MDISLSPDNEKFLQSQIAAGIYNSINEECKSALLIPPQGRVYSKVCGTHFNA